MLAVTPETGLGKGLYSTRSHMARLGNIKGDGRVKEQKRSSPSCNGAGNGEDIRDGSEGSQISELLQTSLSQWVSK